MTLDEALEIINNEIMCADEEVHVLADTDHFDYSVGKLVGLLKAKNVIQAVMIAQHTA